MEKLFKRFQSLCERPLTRRGFLKVCLALAGLALFSRRESMAASAVESALSTGRPKRGSRGEHDLVVTDGEDPRDLVVRAMQAMGGMSRFVRPKDVVVIKPNIGWDRTPEQAGNTNPLVVAALVELAFQAGAKKVKVFDVTCNDARRCYENSGIRRAAEEKGASVFLPIPGMSCRLTSATRVRWRGGLFCATLWRVTRSSTCLCSNITA